MSVVPGLERGASRPRFAWPDLSPLTRRRLSWGLFFISSWLIGFFAFTAYPIGPSLFFSFTDYNIIYRTPHLVGWDNYADLLDGRYDSWKSLRVTLRHLGMLVALATVFDVMLLNMKVRALSIYSTVFYLSAMAPVVAASQRTALQSLVFVSVWGSGRAG